MFSERLGGGTQLAQPETQEGWKGFRGYKWLRERERELRVYIAYCFVTLCRVQGVHRQGHHPGLTVF